MSCQTVSRCAVYSMGLLLTSTSVFALPADVGRTADVFTNAIRYQVAARPVVTSPKLRPADLVLTTTNAPIAEPETEVLAVPARAVVPFDPAEFAKVDSSFEVSLEAIDLGPRWISAFTDDDLFDLPVAPVDMAALDIPLQYQEDRAFDQSIEPVAVASLNIPSVFMEDVAFGKNVRPVAVASLNIPSRYREDELHGVSVAPIAVADLDIPARFKEDEIFQVALAPVDLRTLVIPRATYDDAFEVPLQPISLANLDVPPAQFQQVEDSTITQAALEAPDSTAAAATSSRPDVADETALLDAAVVADEVSDEDADIMSQMAEADENLVVRDGGEDGIDTMMMSSDVLFSFGSASLADDALTTLASIGDMADEVPVLEVFGHTDAIGSESNNLRLGQERAEVVRAWLLENTPFTEDRIIATGIGETDPVAPNVTEAGDDNPDGRAQNRRVEFAFHEAGYVPE